MKRKQLTSKMFQRHTRPKKERKPSALESLPEGALFLVAEHLAQLEPGGVRGPSLASKDLCSLELACKGLRSTAQHGIQALAQQVLHELQQRTQLSWLERRLPPTDATDASAAAAAGEAADFDTEHGLRPAAGHDAAQHPRTSWQFWDDLLSAVALDTCSNEDLLRNACWLGTLSHVDDSQVPLLPQGRLKSSLLSYFGLKTATARVPAVLLIACKHERCSERIVADGGPEGCAALHAALKRLAGLAREVWLPLGLQAQSWGYGRRRPPGWPRNTVVPDHQKGVAHQLPGGLAAIRAGVAAAGIHSLPQLQQLVAAEVEKDTQRRADLDAELGPQQQQRQKAVSQAWRQARQQAGQQRLAEQAARLWEQTLCSKQCGSLAAKHCVRGCCGECCRKAAAAAVAAVAAAGQDVEMCVRHKVAEPAPKHAAAPATAAAADEEADVDMNAAAA